MFDFTNPNNMFMDQWQKMVSDWFDKVLKNPEFVKNVGQSMDSVLSSKVFIDEMRNKMMKSFDLPTADLVGKIAQYSIRQEAKISELEDMIYEQNKQITDIKEMLEKALAIKEKESSTIKKKSTKKSTTAKTVSKKKKTVKPKTSTAKKTNSKKK